MASSPLQLAGFPPPFLAWQNDWLPLEGSKESETSNRCVLGGPGPPLPEVQQKPQWELVKKAGGVEAGCRLQVKAIHSLEKHPKGRGSTSLPMLESLSRFLWDFIKLVQFTGLQSNCGKGLPHSMGIECPTCVPCAECIFPL